MNFSFTENKGKKFRKILNALLECVEILHNIPGTGRAAKKLTELLQRMIKKNSQWVGIKCQAKMIVSFQFTTELHWFSCISYLKTRPPDIVVQLITDTSFCCYHLYWITCFATRSTNSTKADQASPNSLTPLQSLWDCCKHIPVMLQAFPSYHSCQDSWRYNHLAKPFS